MSPIIRRPLLSVVIPTHNRPQFLPRAVQSVLNHHTYDVEVIVIPNGSDESWKTSLLRFKNTSRVRISPIKLAHANRARNHGMHIATGKYIRFLDDDDYLLPAAEKQLEALERTGAEICAGRLSNRGLHNADYGITTSPCTSDFVAAAVTLSGFTATTGNVFRRKSLDGCKWDTRVHRAQDYAWLLDLARRRDYDWTRIEEPVVVWFHHSQKRVSSAQRLTERKIEIVRRLLTLPRQLDKQGRLSYERSQAIANALWYYVHRGFPNHPCYWYSIARFALNIDSTSRPTHPLFNMNISRPLNPLAIEAALLPARLLSQSFKCALEATGYRNNVRKI